jgi:hypothetical protein
MPSNSRRSRQEKKTVKNRCQEKIDDGEVMAVTQVQREQED